MGKIPDFKLQTVFSTTSCEKCTRRLRVGVWHTVTSSLAGSRAVSCHCFREQTVGVACLCWSRPETCRLTRVQLAYQPYRPLGERKRPDRVRTPRVVGRGVPGLCTEGGVPGWSTGRYQPGQPARTASRASPTRTA